MKKFILLSLPCLLLLSCGPSEEEQREMYLRTVDSLTAITDDQVNDYCNCLQDKTIEECDGFYDQYLSTWSTADEFAEFFPKYKVSMSDYQAKKDKLIVLFDQGAACAKEAIAKEGTGESGNNSSDANTGSQQGSSGNAQKESKPKSDAGDEKDSEEEEEEHHHDSPY